MIIGWILWWSAVSGVFLWGTEELILAPIGVFFEKRADAQVKRIVEKARWRSHARAARRA